VLETLDVWSDVAPLGALDERERSKRADARG
jgi:hypothetical protein